MRKPLFALPLFLLGCASTSSYVRSDGTTLGRVVVYRNGVAYFERTAEVKDDVLKLVGPGRQNRRFPEIAHGHRRQDRRACPDRFSRVARALPRTGFTEMKIHLAGKGPHQVKLSYVTETPAWKPSYRLMLGKDGKVDMQAWAIVDNTSGEDWNNVKLGVGSSSALSFPLRSRGRSGSSSARRCSRTIRSRRRPPWAARRTGSRRRQARLGELTDGAIAANERTMALAIRRSAPATSVCSRQAPARRQRGRRAERTIAPTSGAGAWSRRGARCRAQVPTSRAWRRRSRLQPPDRRRGLRRQTDKDKIRRLARAGQQGARSAASRTASTRAKSSRSARARRRGTRRRCSRSSRLLLLRRRASRKAGGQADPAGSADPRSDRYVALRIDQRDDRVAKGTSAMVSILDTKTDGEVVYLYDAESPRGNAGFPFKAVRLKNPTDSVLESGPVTVFGEGRFIGEGLSEPIPARSVAFVPFALDRQIVVERKDEEPRQHRAHSLGAARRVLERGAAHPAVRLRAPQPHGRAGDGLRSAHRRRRLQAHQRHQGRARAPRRCAPLSGRPSRRWAPPSWWSRRRRPSIKTIDLRSPGDMEQVRVYLSSGAVESALKGAHRRAHQDPEDLGNVEQRIVTTREQMQAYRTRMDELHAQIVTLRMVKTGKGLMRNLEKKLQDVSDKLSQSTIDLAGLEEKRCSCASTSRTAWPTSRSKRRARARCTATRRHCKWRGTPSTYRTERGAWHLHRAAWHRPKR